MPIEPLKVNTKIITYRPFPISGSTCKIFILSEVIDIWKLPDESEDIPKYLSVPIYTFTTSTSTICKTCCLIEKGTEFWVTVPKEDALVIVDRIDYKYNARTLLVSSDATVIDYTYQFQIKVGFEKSEINFEANFENNLYSSLTQCKLHFKQKISD